MDSKIEYQMMKPFGPPIGFARLSKDVVNKLIKLTDTITESKDKINQGPMLAGQIESETNIPLEILEK